MHVPTPPPNRAADAFMRTPDAIVAIVSRAADLPLDPYHPWDKVRNYKPPEGMSREEWWAAIKLRRRAAARPLPLFDTDRRIFTYVLTDTILRLVTRLGSRASGHIGIAEPVANPSTRERYVVSSLIEESITSSQLEGATTSRRVAKDMLRTGRDPLTRSERMIWNNYAAMNFIREIRDEPLTPDHVCRLQEIVTQGTLDNPNGAGSLQQPDDPHGRVEVFDVYGTVLHTPPPAADLPDRIRRLCAFANEPDDPSEPDQPWLAPVLRAITLHFMVGYDHYFEDGNGRTARALFYWCLLNRGYWLSEFVTISSILNRAQAQYGRSFLHTEQDEGDMTYFFEYHLRVLERAFDRLEAYLGEKVAELRETRALLGANPRIYNHRQLALIEHAAKDPTAAFTAQSHARSHRIVYETSRQDLMDLEHRGLLRREKVGRRFVWTPVPDLKTRLHGPAN